MNKLLQIWHSASDFKKTIILIPISIVVLILTMYVVSNLVAPPSDLNPCDCNKLEYKADVVGLENMGAGELILIEDCRKYYSTKEESAKACMKQISENSRK